MAADASPYIPPAIYPSHLQDEDGRPTDYSFSQLLTFNLTHAENLYTYHSRTHEFQFHYSEGEFMTRLKTTTNPTNVHYAVAFTPASGDLNGINYLGNVQVTYEGDFKAFIRLPGERTYDPSSDSDCADFLDSHSFHFLTAVTAAKVMAAKCGADLAFIKEIHRVTKPVLEKYHRRLWFNEWMQFQVEKACFERTQPLDYPGYLNVQMMQKVLIFSKDNSREFLTTHKPPKNYYVALLDNEDVRGRLQQDMGQAEFSKLSAYLNQEGVAVAIGKRLGIQQAASGHEPEHEQEFESELFPKEEEEKNPRDPTFSQIKAKVKALELKYLEGIRAASGNPEITLEKPLSQQCVIT